MKKLSKYIDLTTIEGRQLFYQSKEWRALRRLILRNNPYCVDCIKTGLYKVATEVDHIIDIKIDPSKYMDINNLQALCKSCHGKKTFNNHISFQKPTYTVVNKKWDFIH